MSHHNDEAKHITISIDSKKYQVLAGENLLQTCLALGLDLPYFCWHSELGSVGACRQCAVTQYQNNEDKIGRLIMACMTQVSDGMQISMQDTKSAQFRQTNIEAIMTQHPHDCPVCEEGGNCHLQDMTVISGHINRRYTGKKRTHLNQYLGPMLNHDMNRCIGCYRCIRFYRDYCGGKDLNVFGSKNHLYFGRANAGVLENSFAGNLAEVCPTGVFTDKPFSEHYTRKWDLQSAPSICPHCSLGCNITISERDKIIRRITNRKHDEVNGHFLCNLGLFGYEHANHYDRLDKPLKRNIQTLTTDTLENEEAMTQLQTMINTSKAGSCIALGSARTCIENNAALLKLVGQDNFYCGVSDKELQMLQMLYHAYLHHSVNPVSITEAQTCDAAFIINEDISNTAPRLALGIRQMTRNAGIEQAQQLGVQYWQDDAVRNIAQASLSPLMITGCYSTDLSELASHELIASPSEQHVLLNDIITLLQEQVSNNKAGIPSSINTAHIECSNQAKSIAIVLIQSKKPLVISGMQGLSPDTLALSLQLAEVLKQLNTDARFYGVTKQANDLHLAMLHPKEQVKANVTQGIDAFVNRLITSNSETPETPETIIILETDLHRYISVDKLSEAFDQVKNIIVIDQMFTPTAKMADLVIPSTSFAESQGSYLSSEGRLQYAFAVTSGFNQRRLAWRWLVTLTGLSCDTQIHDWLAKQVTQLAKIMEFSNLSQINKNSAFSIARQPTRSSARTAINAANEVKEYPPEEDLHSPFNHSMEGVAGFRQSQVQLISVLPANAWSPKWNSDQGANRRNTQTNSPWTMGITIFDTNNTEIKPTSTARFSYDPAASLSPKAVPTSKELTRDTLSDEVFSPPRLPLFPLANLYTDFELASFSQSIQSMDPNACLQIHPSLAASLHLHNGQVVCLQGRKQTFSLPCRFNDSQSPHIALVPSPIFALVGNQVHITPDDDIGGTS